MVGVKFLQYETFVVIGTAMVVLTFLKVIGLINLSSDWFWFIAGIGLVIEGHLAMKKDRQFKKKFKVMSKEEFEKLSNKNL